MVAAAMRMAERMWMRRMRDPRQGQEIFPYHSGVGGHKKGVGARCVYDYRNRLGRCVDAATILAYFIGNREC